MHTGNIVGSKGFARRLAASQDDDVLFVSGRADTDSQRTATQGSWRVLVVDDDASVHEATLLSLRNARIGGRTLQFFHAHSAAEALAVLQREGDVDIMLLDVMMETRTAGLDLVRALREGALHTAVKIVLRSGQPGLYDEASVRADYAVDAYLSKSRQTRRMMLELLEQLLGGAAPQTQ